jgi:hypothetical protein
MTYNTSLKRHKTYINILLKLKCIDYTNMKGKSVKSFSWYVKVWRRKFFIIDFLWRCDPMRVMASSFLRFLDHTQRRNTFGRTPLQEWSACRRDLYLTAHNTHNRTFMPPVKFEPTISAGERPQTYVLDRTATGTGGIELGIRIVTIK